MDTLLWLLRELARLLGKGKAEDRPSGATTTDLRVYTAYWDESKIDLMLDLLETRLRDPRPLSAAHCGHVQTFLYNARVAFPRFTERCERVGETLTRPKEG